MSAPIFDNPHGAARRANVARSVVLRLLASGAIAPDAFIQRADSLVPLLLPERTAEILRLQKFTRQITPICKS